MSVAGPLPLLLLHCSLTTPADENSWVVISESTATSPPLPYGASCASDWSLSVPANSVQYGIVVYAAWLLNCAFAKTTYLPAATFRSFVYGGPVAGTF